MLPSRHSECSERTRRAAYGLYEAEEGVTETCGSESGAIAMASIAYEAFMLRTCAPRPALHAAVCISVVLHIDLEVCAIVDRLNCGFEPRA